MRSSLLATLLAAAGCIVPSTKVSRSVVDIETKDVVPPQRAPMELQLQRVAANITVRVYAPRMCVRDTYEDADVTRAPSAELMLPMSGGDNLLELALFLVAPFTLVASGLLTLAYNASADTTVKRERRKTASKRIDCPVPGPGLHVVLTLPSGATLEGVTDARGEAMFVVPDSEPQTGVLVASIVEIGAKQATYDRADHRAECLQHRSELMLEAQQITDVKERTRLLLALPACAPK